MHPLARAARRTLLRLEDWARTHAVSGWFATLRLPFALLSRRRRCDAIASFLVSNATVPGRKVWARAGVRSARARNVPPAATDRETMLEWAIIAKAPRSADERGILFVSFERELEKLVNHAGFETVEAEYQIAFLPTWQPAHSRALFQLAARATRPYLLLPAGKTDLRLDGDLGPLCVPIPLHAASWIPADHFPAAPPEHKDIDLVILANFSKYKRHWKLFEALSQLDERYRTVCAGRPWGGRDAATLRREAEAFGVADRVEFITNPSDAAVARLLARGRLFCALSHKEGAFVAAAEALLAGTPVGMFANAFIGTKEFINAETGFLFDPSQPLGAQLRKALARAANLSPQRWARREISADVSIRRFNELMRFHSSRQGLPWTQDAVPIYARNFAFFYGSAGDARSLGPCYTRLHTLHNIRFRSGPVA